MSYTHASRGETARIDAAIQANTSWETFTAANPTIQRSRWDRRAEHLTCPTDRQASASQSAAPLFAPGTPEDRPVLMAPERGTFILCLHNLRAGQQTSAGADCDGSSEFRNQCQNLVAQVIESMAPYVRRGGVDRLIVLFGGDILDRLGSHPGRNAATLDAQVNSAVSVLSCDLLAVLARQFPDLEIDTALTVGDQGRIGPRRHWNYFGNNSDKLIYDGIMRRFHDCPEAAPNLVMIEPDDWFAFFSVYEHNVFAEHGDKTDGRGDARLVALRRQEHLRNFVEGGIDLYIMGHLPAAICAAKGRGYVIVNGSWPATSGAAAKRRSAPPQKLLYVTPERPVDACFELRLVGKLEQDQPEARDGGAGRDVKTV